MCLNLCDADVSKIFNYVDIGGNEFISANDFMAWLDGSSGSLRVQPRQFDGFTHTRVSCRRTAARSKYSRLI